MIFRCQAMSRIAEYDDLLMDHGVPGTQKRRVDPDVVDSRRLMVKKDRKRKADVVDDAPRPIPFAGHRSGFWIAEMGGSVINGGR